MGGYLLRNLIEPTFHSTYNLPIGAPISLLLIEMKRSYILPTFFKKNVLK